MKWTESDIATFWEMKREGATLLEIAEHLGRNYSAVATYSSKQSKKMKPKEDKPMIIENGKPLPGIPAQEPESETGPTPVTAPEPPKLDIAVQQALAMIAAQGLAFDIMHMSLSDGGATLELHFARR